MMKNKLLIILVLIQLGSPYAEAQSPGYLGKTFSLGYDVNFFPQFAYDFDGDYFPTSFNFRSGIVAEYVIQRHKTVGLSFYKFNSAIDFKKAVSYDADYLGINYPALRFSAEAEGKLSIVAVAANIKLFSRQHLAPLGSYAKFEILYTRSEIAYDTTELFVKGKFDQGVQVLPAYQNQDIYNGVGLGFTYGVQRIMFDRLILNVGTQFCWMITTNPFTVFNKNNTDLEVDNYLKYQAARRLSYHYGINLECGISYLIF